MLSSLFFNLLRTHNVHQLTLVSFCHLQEHQQRGQISGVSIPFIMNCRTEFENAYADLTSLLRYTRGSPPSITCDERMDYPVFIDGASGAGKTRTAVELYLKVKDDLAALDLHGLAYVRVVMSEVTERTDDKEGAFAAVMSFILQQYSQQSTATPFKTLEDLMDSIFPGEKRTALYLNLDEFQENEKATAILLSEVKKYNSRKPHRPILLVCSGLYTSAALLGTVSQERAKLEVRYLDEAGAYDLVRGAAIAFAMPPGSTWMQAPAHLRNLLPQKLSEAPVQVCYLVEDTGGWALACAQLAVELVLKANEANVMRTDALGEVDFQCVENNVLGRLTRLYQENIKSAAQGLSDFGLAKLLLLALAPISVSFCSYFCWHLELIRVL